MKLASLLTSFVLAAGVIAATPTTASADCTYAMCEQTSTNLGLPKSVKEGKSVKACVTVTTRGNVAPRGVMVFKTSGPGGFNKTVKQRYNGGRECTTLGKFKKSGKYKVVANFEGGDGFRDSKDSGSFTVKKRKK